jgi:uncharacterized protein (DUF58 family)
VRYASLALWPSPRGIWLLLLVCALLALASIVPAAGFAFVAALAVVVVLVGADLRAGPAPSDLELTRTPMAYAAVGRRARLEYAVVNRAPIALRISIAEAVPAHVFFEEDLTEISLGPRSRSVFARPFVARERGVARFPAVYVQVRNRIGVMQRRFVLAAPLEVRIYPDFSAVEGYGTLARRSTLLDAGLRRLRLRGAGNEFESLRDYEPGDAFRSVDWKATARRGRLTVAQYEVERSQTVIVALDAGRLMTPRIGGQRKFDYALTAGLSVARVAQVGGDNVGLVAFAARQLLHVVPRRGIAHHAALVRAAYDLQPRLEEPDYETLAADLKRRYTKRSLIVVFTDLFDPAASTAVLGSLALLAPRHLVMCVLMNDAAIGAALAGSPRTPAQAYRAAVALTLEDERREAIARLRARGVLVVDAAAQRLTVALMDAYLDVKARGLL